MSANQTKDSGYTVTGQVRREIEIAASVGQLYDYLSDVGTFVKNVPGADRVVTSPDRQRGQVFLTVGGLGKIMSVTLAVELDPASSREAGLIHIHTADERLVQPRSGTLVGKYVVQLKISPLEASGETALSRLSAKLQIGVDLSPMTWTRLMPKAFWFGAAQAIFQQQMSHIFDGHLANLKRNLPQEQRPPRNISS